MLLVASLFYGSLHMLAWDSAVLRARGVEEMFWKASCLLLVGLGPLAFCVWAGLKAWRGPGAHLTLSKITGSALGVAALLVSLAYAASRVYLVVEAVLVIPYLDPSVYQEPDYAVYWPHIG